MVNIFEINIPHRPLMGAMQNKTCYFCGGKATTREHVPPKGIFPKELRHNLICVPSCELHNTQKSGDDEYFRIIIAGAAWNFLPTSLQETIIRSVKRKPFLAKKLIDQSRKKENSIIQYDSELPRIQIVLESIARGLLFHEFSVVYKGKPSILIADFLALSNVTPISLRDGKYEALQEMCRNLLIELPECGNNREIFLYKCTYDMIQFKFYGCLLATVVFSGEHS